VALGFAGADSGEEEEDEDDEDYAGGDGDSDDGGDHCDGELVFEIGSLSSCQEEKVEGEMQTNWQVAFPNDDREYDLSLLENNGTSKDPRWSTLESDYGTRWVFVEAVTPASPAPVAAAASAPVMPSDCPAYNAKCYSSLLLKTGKRFLKTLGNDY